MTRQVTVRIACDSCGCERQSKHLVPGDLDEFTALAQLRTALSDVGWICDQANDSDTCSTCLTRREAPLRF